MAAKKSNRAGHTARRMMRGSKTRKPSSQIKADADSKRKISKADKADNTGETNVLETNTRETNVLEANANEANVDDASAVLCDRVTDLRKKHKLTLDQLATASGVSRSMLSQIERGQANPTLAVTFRIAQAFGISIGELVDQPWASSPIEVVHGNDANNLFRSDDECQIRTLSPLHMEKNIEFYELRIEPGAALSSAPHYEGTKELLTVARGTAQVSAGDTNSQLAKGDSAHYRADLNHSIKNIGNSTLVCYLVVTSQH